MSRTICRSCRSIIARTCSGSIPAPGGSLSSDRPLNSGASGLRSSCASVARNWSLLRSAARNASSAPRRTSISVCSERLDSASAAVCRPTSASIALNASTSTSTSGVRVRSTRSEKSRRSITARATSEIDNSGVVIRACRKADTSSATQRLAAMTASRITR